MIVVGLPWPAGRQPPSHGCTSHCLSQLTPPGRLLPFLISLPSGAPSPAAGFSWAFPEPSGTMQNVPKPAWTSWNPLEYSRASWDPQVPSGTFCIPLERSRTVRGRQGQPRLPSQWRCHMRAWWGRALTDILVSLCPAAFKKDVF